MTDQYDISVTELDEETCWRLLARASFGRVGFVDANGELAVLPVKASLRTAGCDSSTSVISEGLPTSKFTVPGGKPASCKHSKISALRSGVLLEGRLTTVQPAASAAASLRQSKFTGKFHGAMAATTPTGCCHTQCRL